MKLFFVSKSRLTVFSGYAEEGGKNSKSSADRRFAALFLCLPERCFKSIRVVCQFLDSKLFGYQSDDAKEWKQADSCSELRDESLQRSRRLLQPFAACWDIPKRDGVLSQPRPCAVVASGGVRAVQPSCFRPRASARCCCLVAKWAAPLHSGYELEGRPYFIGLADSLELQADPTPIDLHKLFEGLVSVQQLFSPD